MLTTIKILSNIIKIYLIVSLVLNLVALKVYKYLRPDMIKSDKYKEDVDIIDNLMYKYKGKTFITLILTMPILLTITIINIVKKLSV